MTLPTPPNGSRRAGPRAAAGPRSPATIALAIAAMAVAGFALLELTARVALFGFAGLSPMRVNSIRPLPQSGLLRESSVPGLGFELRPGVDAWFKLVPFRTNRQGMRDRAYPLAKAPGTFRVAVVGASFALPSGVAIEDAFHSRLEERLSSPARSVEFLNFAVGMYHARQSLRMLEARALGYAPDLVLFTTTRLSAPALLRAPHESSPEDRGIAALPKRERTLPFLRSFALRSIRKRVFGDEAVVHRSGWLEGLACAALPPWDPMAPEPGDPPASARADPLRAEVRPLIELLAELGQRAGIPVALVRLEFDPAAPAAGAAEIDRRARALGLHNFDTRAAFAGRRPSEFWIYELDPHPDARAHAVFADSIASFLAAEGLLPDAGTAAAPPLRPMRRDAPSAPSVPR